MSDKSSYNEVAVAMAYTKLGMRHDPPISFSSCRIGDEDLLAYEPEDIDILMVIHFIVPHILNGTLPYRSFCVHGGISNYEGFVMGKSRGIWLI
jgi:hypothetical protein